MTDFDTHNQFFKSVNNASDGQSDQGQADQSQADQSQADRGQAETDAAELPAKLPASWRYEATVSEVEAIISRIEMGELELAEVFDQFALAVEQLRQCETFLTRQQQQVDVLIETLLDEPEPF